MKSLFFIVCITLCVSSAAAQGFWSVNGGVNCTKLHAPAPDNYKAGFGLQLGTSYSVGVFKNVYFQPGFNVAYHSFKFRNNEIVAIGDMLAERSDSWFKELELMVPVLLSYAINFNSFSVNLFTGPQVNFGVINRLKRMIIIGGGDWGYSLNMYGDNGLLRYKRFGLAWDFGAGLGFANNYSISFMASIGLSDMAMDCSYKIRKNTFAITLGHRF